MPRSKFGFSATLFHLRESAGGRLFTAVGTGRGSHESEFCCPGYAVVFNERTRAGSAAEVERPFRRRQAPSAGEAGRAGTVKHSFQAAAEGRYLTIAEATVDKANDDFLEDTEQFYHDDYIGISSNQTDTQFREVLVACALADTDENGFLNDQRYCALIENSRQISEACQFPAASDGIFV